MGCFFQFYPSSGIEPRQKPGDFTFRNVRVRNAGRFLVMLGGLGALWHMGPAIPSIRFENVVAENCAHPSVLWPAGADATELVFKDCRFTFAKDCPAAFDAANTVFRNEGSSFGNVPQVVRYWAGQPWDFIPTCAPEFPSWDFAHPAADLSNTGHLAGDLPPVEDRDVSYYPAGTDLTPEQKRLCKLDFRRPQKKGFATVVWFHGGGMEIGKRGYIALPDADIAQVAVDYRLMSEKNRVRGARS